MNRFLLDASALAKRYHPEVGSDRMDDLFLNTSTDRFIVLMLSTSETVSVLVRIRNRGQISALRCQQQIDNFRKEIVLATGPSVLEVDKQLIISSFDLIERHSLNSTDAILLSAALEVVADLRSTGDDLVIVASDKRLLRSAHAEGIATLDPEVQTQAEVLQLIGP